jgi:putative tricarboxylic transport membrane protein
MTKPGGPGATPGPLLGLRIAAVALLVLGSVVLNAAFQITRAGGYSVVGPGAVPIAVGIALIVLSVLFILRTTVLPDVDLFEHVRAAEAATHWPTALLVIGLLIAYALALGPLGYIPATAAFLPVGAWLMGSRRTLRDAVIGICLAIVVYVAFTYLLGLRLPAGLLEPLL